MYILTNIVSLLTTDIRTTVITLIIAFIVYKLSKFYHKVYCLPPGPIPSPFLGNILLFRQNLHWSAVIENIINKYGPVCTIWVGPLPFIFISDIDLGREAFRRTEFAGRANDVFVLCRLISNEKHSDIGAADYGPLWETLRKVAHSAVLKYSPTDKLVYLVSDCVDYTIDVMIKKEGLNKPFVSGDYIFNIILNVLANSAFGHRYELDDPEYKAIRYLTKDFYHEVNEKYVFLEFFPFLRPFYRNLYKRLETNVQEHIDLLKIKFQSHYKDYDESVIRDFCDTLISAKNDALRDGKESAPYLKDENLALVIFDLLIVGTDTSFSTFRWVLLLMKYFPEVENKLRQEIETQIGDRIPTHEDRERCHYTMAFISEILRFRNPSQQSVPHKAMVTSKIGNHVIPERTQLIVYQGHILRNEKYWPNGKEFRPERFLENGKYVKTGNKAYIPFGVGRRVCLGERLALAHLFLILVRFIQKTSDYELTLHFDGDLEPDPNVITDYMPKTYKISLNKK